MKASRVDLFIQRLKLQTAPKSEGDGRVDPPGEDDPTDLEELTNWTSCIILLGGLAVGIVIIIGLVVLAVWAR